MVCQLIHIQQNSGEGVLTARLERRATYIRLVDAVPEGHVVHYEFVQGVRNLVEWIGRAFGFKTVSDSVLQVRNV